MSIPDNNILDIIISITLIYALLSILASILLEWWNQWRKSRAALLRESIERLLNDDINLDFGQLFYNHYLINGMRNKERRPPQYVSSRMFTEVIIDIIADRELHNLPIKLKEITTEGKIYEQDGDFSRDVITRFKISLSKMNPSPLIDTLNSFCDKAGGNYESLKKLISEWYDDYQDRVTGLYKFKQRNPLILFGFLVALGLNVDTIHLVRMISLDDGLRANLVQNAEQVASRYNELADSSKQKTTELEGVLKNVFPDSLTRNGNWKILKTRGKHNKNDSLISKYSRSIDSLLLSDSLSQEYKQRATRVLNVTSELNIPIGWSWDSAPLIWFNPQSDLSQHPTEVSSKKQSVVFAYIDKRNNQSIGNVILYLAGIIISGISLSFGAPFWFETMTKLINVRRAGNKPKSIDENK